MPNFNEILDIQDENDDLRKVLREIREKANGILSNIQSPGSESTGDLVELLSDTVEGLNKIICMIDTVL